MSKQHEDVLDLLEEKDAKVRKVTQERDRLTAQLNVLNEDRKKLMKENEKLQVASKVLIPEEKEKSEDTSDFFLLAKKKEQNEQGVGTDCFPLAEEKKKPLGGFWGWLAVELGSASKACEEVEIWCQNKSKELSKKCADFLHESNTGFLLPLGGGENKSTAQVSVPHRHSIGGENPLGSDGSENPEHFPEQMLL